MLIKRLMSAVFLIGILILCVMLSQGKWTFVSFIGAQLMVGLGLKEFFDLIKAKGIRVNSFIGIFIGLVFSTVIYWTSYFHFLTAEWEILYLFISIGLIFLFQSLQKKGGSCLVSSALNVLSLIYVAWLFSFFYKIVFFPGLQGALFVFFAFLVTKSSDIIAYFVGSLLGKHPLAPTISPKKTIEGAVGGVLGSIGAAFLGQALFFPELKLPGLFVFGLTIGIIGIVGDLLESLFKRDANVKDSGKFIPGMGGVLDVLDSLFFTAPITYFYMKFIVA